MRSGWRAKRIVGLGRDGSIRARPGSSVVATASSAAQRAELRALRAVTRASRVPPATPSRLPRAGGVVFRDVGGLGQGIHKRPSAPWRSPGSGPAAASHGPRGICSLLLFPLPSISYLLGYTWRRNVGRFERCHPPGARPRPWTPGRPCPIDVTERVRNDTLRKADRELDAVLRDREAVLAGEFSLRERAVYEEPFGPDGAMEKLRLLGEEGVDWPRVDGVVLHTGRHERRESGCRGHREDRGHGRRIRPTASKAVASLARLVSAAWGPDGKTSTSAPHVDGR